MDDYPRHLIEKAEELKPSNDPAFWAKKSCRKCYGRGVIGDITTVMKGNNRVTQPLICSCTRKPYQVWLRQTIDNLQKQSVAPTDTPITAENHSES